MTPSTEADFDQFLLQLSTLRNDAGEASQNNSGLERHATLRDFITKRLDPAGDGLLDPSLWVA